MCDLEKAEINAANDYYAALERHERDEISLWRFKSFEAKWYAAYEAYAKSNPVKNI